MDNTTKSSSFGGSGHKLYVATIRKCNTVYSIQCNVQYIVQCSTFTAGQYVQCNLQSNVHNVQARGVFAEQCVHNVQYVQRNVHNVQSSMCRAMCAEQCAEEYIYCRSVCAVQCVPMQCNLQLSSQLVNLLLLDWTRSSQLRNIANLSPLKICFPMFVFGRNFNVFTCSSTTVLLPNTHISCCNYKLM